jgi:hypothetical protein
MRLPDMLKWIIGMSYNTDAVGLPASATTLQLRVPFIHQDNVNLCGDAAALMIAKFWQLDTIIDTSVNPRGAFEGSDVREHVKITTFGKLKWDLVDPPGTARTWTAAEVRDRLSTRGPLACALSHSTTVPVVGTVEWGHWIVLTGVDTATNALMYHDPWRGQHKTMQVADLNRQLDWDDAGTVVCLSGIR